MGVTISQVLQLNDATSVTLADGANNDVSLGAASILRATPGTGSTITGVTNGEAGRLLCIANLGGSNITIKAEDAGSTAANRFGIANDVTLSGGVGRCRWFYYDGTASRWRVLL